MKISIIKEKDLSSVMRLNTNSIPHVNLISKEKLQWLIRHSALSCIAKINGELAGFLIGFRAGSSYSSPNYKWFCKNYNDFAYVDRVVVGKQFRRKGVAKFLYNYFAKSQREATFMTCEVNITPPNPNSMLFHKHMGFKKVGTQENKKDKVKVAFLEKVL